MKIRQRDLRSADQPEIVLGVTVDVVGELGHLAGAPHRLLLDQERRIDFGIPVLLHMQIQHPADERPLQL